MKLTIFENRFLLCLNEIFLPHALDRSLRFETDCWLFAQTWRRWRNVFLRRDRTQTSIIQRMWIWQTHNSSLTEKFFIQLSRLANRLQTHKLFWEWCAYGHLLHQSNTIFRSDVFSTLFFLYRHICKLPQNIISLL